MPGVANEFMELREQAQADAMNAECQALIRATHRAPHVVAF